MFVVFETESTSIHGIDAEDRSQHSIRYQYNASIRWRRGKRKQSSPTPYMLDPRNVWRDRKTEGHISPLQKRPEISVQIKSGLELRIRFLPGSFSSVSLVRLAVTLATESVISLNLSFRREIKSEHSLQSKLPRPWATTVVLPK